MVIFALSVGFAATSPKGRGKGCVQRGRIPTATKNHSPLGRESNCLGWEQTTVWLSQWRICTPTQLLVVQPVPRAARGVAPLARGPLAPLKSRFKGIGFSGKGGNRNPPFPERVFGYFLHEQKVTQGVGMESPHGWRRTIFRPHPPAKGESDLPGRGAGSPTRLAKNNHLGQP